jgi:hypothetical protein
MFEKRSHVRYAQDGKVNIRTESDASKIVKGELINISFRGFAAYLKEKIDINTIFQFDLITDLSYKPLIGRGKIKNINEAKINDIQVFLVNAEFIDVEKNNIVMLLDLIRSSICQEKRKKAQSIRIRSKANPHSVY